MRSTSISAFAMRLLHPTGTCAIRLSTLITETLLLDHLVGVDDRLFVGAGYFAT